MTGFFFIIPIPNSCGSKIIDLPIPIWTVFVQDSEEVAPTFSARQN
jgi:hypothetical protein